MVTELALAWREALNITTFRSPAFRLTGVSSDGVKRRRSTGSVLTIGPAAGGVLVSRTPSFARKEKL